MTATCLAALSRQSPKPEGARLLARGLDGVSACQAIIVRAILLPATTPQTRMRAGTLKNGANDLTFDNPIGTRLSPISPVRSVTYLSGPDRLSAGRSGRI